MIGMIVVGLIGLGLVVFVHELGHFVAAKLVGVQVDTFSLGWGPRLIGFKRGNTDYRLSLIPIGGFCAMKGEDQFKKALEENLPEIPKEPGTFYGASPWRRIVISLAGPVFNLIFAILVLSVVYGVGVRISTTEPRIALASDYQDTSKSPNNTIVAQTGLKTGDIITAINGKKVSYYSEINEAIAISANKQLLISVLRNGMNEQVSVVPMLNKKTGAGDIGILPWIDPVIETVNSGSAASFADLKAGDRIIAMAGTPVLNSMEVSQVLRNAKNEIVISIDRAGEKLDKLVIFHEMSKAGVPFLGIHYRVITYVDRATGFLNAIGRGYSETWRTFAISLKGLATLFSGVDILSAVSGPARIIYMTGEVASQGFETGVTDGIVSFFNFLSLLSIVLFIMNLLPIPALDGGQIVLFAIEGIRKKPLGIKTIYRYQFVGLVLIFGLFLMSTLADFLFFTGH
jgi:regulator of sigma E protease